MYKDPDKQREANKKASQRQRDKQKGMTVEGMTNQGMTDGSIPIEVLAKVDKACGEHLAHGLKRGNDIKCFEDLPPDVQRTIDRMSIVNGKIDQTIKANRTAIAINYQHLFPDRYYGTGVAI